MDTKSWTAVRHVKLCQRGVDSNGVLSPFLLTWVWEFPRSSTSPTSKNRNVCSIQWSKLQQSTPLLCRSHLWWFGSLLIYLWYSRSWQKSFLRKSELRALNCEASELYKEVHTLAQRPAECLKSTNRWVHIVTLQEEMQTKRVLVRWDVVMIYIWRVLCDLNMLTLKEAHPTVAKYSHAAAALAPEQTRWRCYF